jgi:hypothetical protein
MRSVKIFKGLPIFPYVFPVIFGFFFLTHFLINQGKDYLQQQNIQQLKNNRKCFGCDLSKMNLAGINLEDV